jgi:hypothetical protein
MRRNPTRAPLLAVAIAVVLLAGCGASSGSDAADGTTTSGGRATTTQDGGTTIAPDATTTTEADGSTTTAPTDDDGICGPLKDLADFDAKAQRLVAGGNWPEIKAFYVGQAQDIVAIYDDAIGYDSEITPELKTLRAVTVSAGDLAEASKDLMDFSTKLTAQPGLSESGAAALKANDFARETCGFPLAGL